MTYLFQELVLIMSWIHLFEIFHLSHWSIRSEFVNGRSSKFVKFSVHSSPTWDRNSQCCRSIHNTGWRRLIKCLKLQVIFRKRAINYRALLWKMTCKDKASYRSSLPCSPYLRAPIRLNIWNKINIFPRLTKKYPQDAATGKLILEICVVGCAFTGGIQSYKKSHFQLFPTIGSNNWIRSHLYV